MRDECRFLESLEWASAAISPKEERFEPGGQILIHDYDSYQLGRRDHLKEGRTNPVYVNNFL
jgi:hypothetical protein